MASCADWSRRRPWPAIAKPPTAFHGSDSCCGRRRSRCSRSHARMPRRSCWRSGSIRLGAGLVVAQMTACTLLVISTGLRFAGFRSALQTSAGRRLADAIVVSREALQTSSKAVEAASGLRYFDDAVRVTQEVASATSVASGSSASSDRANFAPGRAPCLRPCTFRWSRISCFG